MLLLHKHKIIHTAAQQLKFFCWTVSVLCGTTAGAAGSKISNRPVTFESNRNRTIRIWIESRSFAGPYKERCVDNAVGLDDQRRCARQPEVQSKVDVLGGLPVTVAEYRLNLARPRKTDWENGYENRSPVFSHERCPNVVLHHYH